MRKVVSCFLRTRHAKMEFESRIGVNKSQAVPGWIVGRKATLLIQLVACVL